MLAPATSLQYHRKVQKQNHEWLSDSKCFFDHSFSTEGSTSIDSLENDRRKEKAFKV